ncbi:MAG: hypothetical protein II453_11180 [Alphaproteobacteria bacterium]|nr:hypothetical protein [Alphaproteobacteria bacterium]
MEKTLNCTITIKGESIKTNADAILALNTMLGCYDDMNDTDTSIVITLKNK